MGYVCNFPGVLAAPLIRKIGHRWTAMAGGFVAAIGYIGACLAPTLFVLILTAGVLTGNVRYDCMAHIYIYI